jgi:hypothetical protein
VPSPRPRGSPAGRRSRRGTGPPGSAAPAPRGRRRPAGPAPAARCGASSHSRAAASPCAMRSRSRSVSGPWTPGMASASWKRSCRRRRKVTGRAEISRDRSDGAYDSTGVEAGPPAKSPRRPGRQTGRHSLGCAGLVATNAPEPADKENQVSPREGACRPSVAMNKESALVWHDSSPVSCAHETGR